jgi:DNA repair protein RadA/Sms
MAHHVCTDCGYGSPRWFGRCPSCGAWGGAAEPTVSGCEIIALDLSGDKEERIGTGIAEVDRVLGGGLVPGSVALLAGEPGIGKSTLMLQLLEGVAAGGRKTLLVSGEESTTQVALRAARLGLTPANLRAAATNSVEAIAETARTDGPTLLVVDSVQSLNGAGPDTFGGTPNRVRECAATLQRVAKDTGTVVVLVGHITKDGAVAGPKTLEHMVDVVLTLEGERSGTLRLLRVVKNRFGACDETGVFLMTERGLADVPDPSSLLLADRKEGVAGSAVFPSLEGSRPLLVEIQALVSRERSDQPRLVAMGLDQRRLTVLTGVLHQRARLNLAGRDVFVAAVGGISVREPAADLAVAAALFSASGDVPLRPDVVAIGEIGLSGELRRVPGVDRRLSEASRLGFASAVVPATITPPATAIRLDFVHDIRGALTSSALTRGHAPAAAAACYP